MRTLTTAFCLLALTAAVDQPRARPVNPNAAKEAQQLLDFLYEIQGMHTLSGQHNFIMAGSKLTEQIHELTGEHPLVWGSDFSFAYQGDKPMRFQHCGPLNLSVPGTKPELTGLTPEKARAQMVKNVIQAHREGYIVTLM
jgi:mannan endo-1,4-beta-mannosidase